MLSRSCWVESANLEQSPHRVYLGVIEVGPPVIHNEHCPRAYRTVLDAQADSSRHTAEHILQSVIDALTLEWGFEPFEQRHGPSSLLSPYGLRT